MTRNRNLQLLIALCIGLASTPASLANEEYADGLVRTAVIFGLLRFTEWPDAEKPLKTIQLCSLGTSPAIGAIQRIPDLPKIGNKQLLYQQKDAKQPLEACHVLLVGMGVKASNSLPHAHLIICDDCEDSYQTLWMVSLIRRDDRIQFEVNLDRAEEKKLKLGASLLELAARCSSKRRRIRGCDG